MEGMESISQIISPPVIHIIGQQAYIAGGEAAVRVIATDTKDETSAGRGTVRIEFCAGDKSPRYFTPAVLIAGEPRKRGSVSRRRGRQLPATLCC